MTSSFASPCSGTNETWRPPTICMRVSSRSGVRCPTIGPRSLRAGLREQFRSLDAPSGADATMAAGSVPAPSAQHDRCVRSCSFANGTASSRRSRRSREVRVDRPNRAAYHAPADPERPPMTCARYYCTNALTSSTRGSKCILLWQVSELTLHPVTLRGAADLRRVQGQP